MPGHMVNNAVYKSIDNMKRLAVIYLYGQNLVSFELLT